MIDEAVSAAVQTAESVSEKATYAGAGVATIFGFSADIFVALSGLTLGLLTLIINLYFKRKMYQNDRHFKGAMYALEKERLRFDKQKAGDDEALG